MDGRVLHNVSWSRPLSWSSSRLEFPMNNVESVMMTRGCGSTYMRRGPSMAFRAIYYLNYIDLVLIFQCVSIRQFTDKTLAMNSNYPQIEAMNFLYRCLISRHKRSLGLAGRLSVRKFLRACVRACTQTLMLA